MSSTRVPDAPPVVVAGGGGFLGSHLCERLLRDGHRVLCVDNFVTGAPRNLEPLAADPRFAVRRHDIAEPLEIDAAGAVFNLACPGDDPVQRCPAIDLARRALGWQPQVPLREGIRRTVEYFDRALTLERRARTRRRKEGITQPRVEPMQVTHVSR